MVNAFPAVQFSSLDASATPQGNAAMQTPGVGIVCQTGVLMQDVTLAANATNVAPAFPAGVSTAAVIAVIAITTTDLTVKVGTGTPVSLSVPARQGLLLYGVASNAVTLSSVSGGQVQVAVGG